MTLIGLFKSAKYYIFSDISTRAQATAQVGQSSRDDTRKQTDQNQLHPASFETALSTKNANFNKLK